MPGTLKIICNAKTWLSLPAREGVFPLFEGVEYLDVAEKSSKQNFIAIDANNIDKNIKQKIFDLVATDITAVLCLYSSNKHSMADVRRTIIELMEHNIKAPVIICVESNCSSVDEQLIQVRTGIAGKAVGGDKVIDVGIARIPCSIFRPAKLRHTLVN